MRTIEEIQREIDIAKRQENTWRMQVFDLEKELAEMQLASFGAVIGSLVKYQGMVFQISSCERPGFKKERPWVFGKKCLANGSVGKTSRRLYNNWEVLSPATAITEGK